MEKGLFMFLLLNQGIRKGIYICKISKNFLNIFQHVYCIMIEHKIMRKLFIIRKEFLIFELTKK